MSFASFVGRVLFASLFILAAWQEFNEFGVDGGPAGRALKPKLNAFLKLVSSYAGVHVPVIDDISHVVAATIAFKGVGGFLFIFGNSGGAYLLMLHQMIITPILYDFYNYENDKGEFAQLFIKFSQNLALAGALLYFLGMKNSIPRRQLKKKVHKTKTF